MLFIAAATLPFSPAGHWQVDYGDKQCRLLREYESGNTRLLFALSGAGESAVQKTSSFFINLLSPADAKTHADAGVAHLSFGDDNKHETRFFAMGKTADGHQLIQTSIDLSSLLELASIKQLRIAASGTDVTLILGATPKVMAVLKDCMDGLQKDWGLDPSEKDRISSPAVPFSSQADWVQHYDYPIDALGKKISGSATAAWTIGVDGRATDCRIVISSGSASLDAASCKAIVARAHYTPAKDKAGKPMIVHTFAKMTWIAPPFN